MAPVPMAVVAVAVAVVVMPGMVVMFIMIMPGVVMPMVIMARMVIMSMVIVAGRITLARSVLVRACVLHGNHLSLTSLATDQEFYPRRPIRYCEHVEGQAGRLAQFWRLSFRTRDSMRRGGADMATEVGG